MQIDELTVDTALRALFPQLDDKEIQIMASIEDLQTAVDNLKAVCGQVGDQLGGIATKLHAHPATNNDAALEGLVGEINTMGAVLSSASFAETAAEPGSVLEDPAAVQPPAPEPIPSPLPDPSTSPTDTGSSLPSSTDTSGSDPSAGTGSTPSSTDGSTDPNVSGDGTSTTPAPTDTTGASSAGTSSDTPDVTP